MQAIHSNTIIIELQFESSASVVPTVIVGTTEAEPTYVTTLVSVVSDSLVSSSEC